MTHLATLPLLLCCSALLAACGREPLPADRCPPGCHFDEGLGCSCNAVPNPPNPLTPMPPMPPEPAPWACTSDGTVETCTAPAELPPGSDWRCQLWQGAELGWSCVGQASGNPGGGGWSCSAIDSLSTLWRCSKKATIGFPRIGRDYACTMTATAQVCVHDPRGQGGDHCQEGEKMWCDGLEYSGWGQVACDGETGRWKTTLVNGKQVLDCRELADATRPDTHCSCYHFFFNPACCERPDCVVPAGGHGRTCAASAGGLCDSCNPQQKGSCKDPQAKCVVTNSHETFCGRLCTPNQPCPTGYQCMVVKLPNAASTNQCIPSDYSCYY